MGVLDLINIIFYVLQGAIIIRAILSMVITLMGGQVHPIVMGFYNAAAQIAEPIVAPIRRVLPSFGMFDFSPMVAIILLSVLQSVINKA